MAAVLLASATQQQQQWARAEGEDGADADYEQSSIAEVTPQVRGGSVRLPPPLGPSERLHTLPGRGLIRNETIWKYGIPQSTLLIH